MDGSIYPLLVTHDEGLAEAVEASAATVGTELHCLWTSDAIRREWRNASVVLVGPDSAPVVAGMALPERRGVYLIGTKVAELIDWSAPLDAPVLALPDDTGALISVLTAKSIERRASTVWVIGARGGLGASTLAAGLGILAAKTARVAMVELDSLGGLDLIFGVEALSGWRWTDLAGASGQLGDLSGLVPAIHGVELITMGRKPRQICSGALAAVFGSLNRSHDYLIVDGGTIRPPGRNARVVLVVGADVVSVAAARVRATEIDLADAEVVVRIGGGRTIGPALVADALGLPLLGVLPQDSRMPKLLASGRPPGVTGGSFRRASEKILKKLRK